MQNGQRSEIMKSITRTSLSIKLIVVILMISVCATILFPLYNKSGEAFADVETVYCGERIKT